MLLHNPEPHADPDDEPQTTLDRSPFFIETICGSEGGVTRDAGSSSGAIGRGLAAGPVAQRCKR
jgi:hypothetical protein